MINPYSAPGMIHTQPLTLKDIEDVVCRQMDVRRDLLHTKLRKQDIVLSRMIISHIGKKIIGKKLSVSVMARFFGQDHSTIIRNEKVLKDRVEIEPEIKAKVDQIYEEVNLIRKGLE